MTTSAVDVDATLRRILHELTARPMDAIEPHHHLRGDLGLDSVASMELVSMLSEELDIDVSIEQALEIETVAEVLTVAHELLDE